MFNISSNKILQNVESLGLGKRLTSFIHRFFGIKAGKKLKPLSKDVVEVKKETPEETIDIVSKLASKSGGSEGLYAKTLTQIINEGADKNPELKAKRLQYLLKNGESERHFINRIVFLGFKNPKNAAFIMDNAEKISQIIKERGLHDTYSYKDFLESINEKTYPTLLELNNNPNIKGQDIMAPVMYMAKEHTVGFGKETVTVPTQEILSLLTGLTSPSCGITGEYTTFNRIADSLVAKGHTCKDLPYMEIAEGIIAQKPELIEMAEKYVTTAERLGRMNLPTEKYYEILGRDLPKEIELRTVIPDNNALSNPSDTMTAYKYFHPEV